MLDQIWKPFVYSYFIATTLCVLVLFEMIFFGLPYITIFLIIFSLVYSFNLSRYRRILMLKKQPTV